MKQIGKDDVFLERRMFNTEGGKKVQNALDEFRKKNTDVLELKGLELKHTNVMSTSDDD